MSAPLHPLESAVLAWLAEANPELRQQLQHAQVSEREFTNGGGVFLHLTQPSDAKPLPNCSSDAAWIDGPAMTSPELQSGALITLWLTGGQVSSLEIWSCASDYPQDRHPHPFSLRTWTSKPIYLA